MELKVYRSSLRLDAATKPLKLTNIDPGASNIRRADLASLQAEKELTEIDHQAFPATVRKGGVYIPLATVVPCQAVLPPLTGRNDLEQEALKLYAGDNLVTTLQGAPAPEYNKIQLKINIRQYQELLGV